MISKVLLEKRKNLLELNKNSQELFLTKGFVNILNYVDKDTLFDFIQDKYSTELKIDCNKILEKTIATLESCQTTMELKSCIESLNIDYDTKSINVENGNEKQRKNIIGYIAKDILSNFQKLYTMNKTSMSEYFDSGKWCLYLCNGVLESPVGTVLSNEKAYVRAPLLVMPVTIKKVAETSLILCKRETEFSLNEMLNVFLKEKINVSYLDPNELENNTSIKTLLTKISNNIPLSKFSEDIVNLKTVRKADYQSFNEPIIHNACFIACINPIGGKMLEDYDAIISSSYNFPSENSMFANTELDGLIYKDDTIAEAGRPLNLSQKKAVLASLKTNTLIYGPPGTGKSEVVASIIANNVYNGYNVLVSSEKKAALDVIADRLDTMKDITMIVDAENPLSFYERIISLNDEIISANKTSFDFIKKPYLELVEYLHTLSDITNDENKSKAINELIDICSEPIRIDYKKYGSILVEMRNKVIVTKADVNKFVDDLYNFAIPGNIIDNYYPINSSMLHVFDKECVERLFNVLSKVTDQHRKYWIIDNFVKENRPKAGLFPKKINDDQSHQVDKMIEALTYVKENNEYTFCLNFSNWKQLINNTDKKELVKALKALCLQQNEMLAPLFREYGGNKYLNNYLNNYWSYSIEKASVTSKLIRNKFLYDLKQKFMGNTQLQHNWIELVKKANLPKKINIAKFIKEYYDVLKFVYPIWILPPDTVANYIPLKNNEFAVGVFDEASQMRVERSIPLVYRCSRSIVSGDDKQLRPSRFFAANIEIDENELTSEDELNNVESLLDKAKIANWASFTLSNHYRSVSEELINFSNKYIYDNKLLCITKAGTVSKPIECVQMPSTTVYDRHTNTNPDEANEVVKIISSRGQEYKKIVIITFNQKQADLIQRLCYENPILTNRIENDTIRIRSIENVQGDEADLVIISTTFGIDADGKFIQNFGPVGQAGGKNRINVMVTRAKTKMIVVKSFMSSSITSTNNENLYILKMFLFYVENLQEDKNVITNQSSESITKPISVVIADELRNYFKDIEIKTNYSIGSHTFNIALIKEGIVKALILINDENDIKSKSINDWINNFDEQRYYKDRGYELICFNTIEWGLIRPQLIEKIKHMI